MGRIAQTIPIGLFPTVNDTEIPANGDEYYIHPRVTMREMEVVKKQIAKKKPAPGPDGVIAAVMRQIIDIIPFRLTDMMDLCLGRGHFPSVWKKARLILLRVHFPVDAVSLHMRMTFC